MQTSDLTLMGQQAKQAAIAMAKAAAQQKNSVLEALAKGLEDSRKEILEANQKDCLAAEQAGLSPAMIDRLSLNGRLKGISQDVRHVAALPDPVGETFEHSVLPNGLDICKRRTPIGVLGIIYESRPNVTIDAAALALKSGNCAILRGGSEALHTNQALISVIQQALKDASLPIQAVQLIPTADRSHVVQLLKMPAYIDLIIPRGGVGLHQFCRENSLIPVMTGGIGICHLYVDRSADLNKAIPVILNAKTQRPTVCNALDTLLVHAQAAPLFLPSLAEALGKAGVKLHLDEKAWHILKALPEDAAACQIAQANDWDTEWLSLTIGIKVVEDFQEALTHIREHSSGHSDGILAQDVRLAEQFVNEIDSAAVYVNASTRFTDGGQLGLGAEVAISTQKLHARGPMGLKELTTYKWVIRGNYHTRP